MGHTFLNYYLMTHEHPPLIVYDEDKGRYYAALQQYDEAEEIVPLLDFLRKQTSKTWTKTLALAEAAAPDRKRLSDFPRRCSG